MSDLATALRSLSEEFVEGVMAAMMRAALSDLGANRVARGNERGARRPPKQNRAKISRSFDGSGAVKPASTPQPMRRRRRASPEDVKRQKLTVLATVRALGGKSVSKGDVMRRTGFREDLGRALTLLVAEGKLKKTGDRRLTRYWLM